jgi:PKHD-type hydroxylase
MLGLDAVLTAEEVQSLRGRLASAAYLDGKLTAGWHARQVKTNEQVPADDPVSRAARAEIEAALRRHPVFTPAVQPKFIQLLINRYGPGQAYGAHVDDAFMNGRRTDVAVTVFLSDPDSYDGGELVIDTTAGEQRVKLPAGAAIIYPATTIHRVESVTKGERLACVGWVESWIRDGAAREILFDLERARRSLFQQHGKTAEFDLIAKACANLLRRWGE